MKRSAGRFSEWDRDASEARRSLPVEKGEQEGSARLEARQVISRPAPPNARSSHDPFPDRISGTKSKHVTHHVT